MTDRIMFILRADTDLRALVSRAFDMSNPQGMGYLHHKPGPITEEEINSVLQDSNKPGELAVRADYIRGRSVKLTVWKDEDGKYLIYGPDWLDHSPEDLNELVRPYVTRTVHMAD